MNFILYKLTFVEDTTIFFHMTRATIIHPVGPILGIVLFLFSTSVLIGQTDTHRFSKIPLTKTYNTTDYDGGIQNWTITQDKRGYIYIANNFGLLEFDGEHWRRYSIENNTRVRSVFVDTDNRIYIGGQNQFGYFEANELGELEFHSLLHTLPEATTGIADVWKIFRHEDEILFNSYLKLIAYDGNECRVIEESLNLDLVFPVASQLYAFSPYEGLMIKNSSGFKRIEGSEFLTKNSVTAVLPHKNNSLLIFQHNGEIHHYSNGKFQPWPTSAASFLESSLINTVVVLKNNNIAIGTQNDGLIILTPDGVPILHLTKGRGINNRTVLALFEDQFNNLWVGLNNGITLVELSSPFSIIDEQSGLPGTGYCATIFDNKLYLGTSNGLFYQESQPNPIASGSEYQLVENSKGQVYNVNNLNGELFLAHHNGAYQVKNARASPIYTGTGTWKFDLTPDNKKLIAGTYEGFITFEKSDNQWRPVRKFNQLNESSRIFEFENDTILWMTHGYKGAYRLTFDSSYDSVYSYSFYGTQKGFPSNILINVFDLGNRLVFPAQNGIYAYETSTDAFSNVHELEAYFNPTDHISELTPDLMGNLYFLSVEELGYLEKNNFGEYEKRTNIFSKIRKFLSDDLENITVLDHQNVLYGAKEGFVHYNPSIKNSHDQPFITYLRRVVAKTSTDTLVFGEVNDITAREYPFPADMNSIRFRYAAPYFDGHDELLYQYQLENFDENWSDWNATTEKEYTNLSHGTYTFKVRAKNIYGDISSMATFNLKIYPPWYKTGFAYFVYAAGLMLMFGISMYILDSKHKNEKKKLTIHQKRELMKKETEIKEVSKKSEAEINKLRNDKLRAEVDHKNRELATTTMHLINKNEFMLSLKETLKDLSKNGSKDAMKKIIRDIDRNLSEDEGWEQFTRHFDQVHGDFLKNLKSEHPTLTPQEIKLCAYLRMNMSSKEIANLLNISVRGVEISRYRLRKKLGLNRETNLVDYMLEYT